VGAYFWAGNHPRRFRLAVKAGAKTLASTDFTRRFSEAPLLTKSETLGHNGFIGRFDYPTGAGGARRSWRSAAPREDSRDRS
jgi:hypothetical protein